MVSFSVIRVYFLRVCIETPCRTRINMGVAFLRTSHLLAYIESIHVSLPYLHLIYKLDRSFFRLAVAKISTSQILDRCPSKFVFVHAKNNPRFILY